MFNCFRCHRHLQLAPYPSRSTGIVGFLGISLAGHSDYMQCVGCMAPVRAKQPRFHVSMWTHGLMVAAAVMSDHPIRDKIPELSVPEVIFESGRDPSSCRQRDLVRRPRHKFRFPYTSTGRETGPPPSESQIMGSCYRPDCPTTGSQLQREPKIGLIHKHPLMFIRRRMYAWRCLTSTLATEGQAGSHPRAWALDEAPSGRSTICFYFFRGNSDCCTYASRPLPPLHSPSLNTKSISPL
jgi:hypothetical protein